MAAKVKFTALTHETFIHAVRDTAIAYYLSTSTDEDKETRAAKLRAVKMCYGRGAYGLRGLTQYNAWKHTEHTDLIEICALGEESWVQLAGTTIHELGHAFAGMGSGHSKVWKDACASLGLRCVLAAGTQYRLAMFHPYLRDALAKMNKPADGAPSLGIDLANMAKVRVCTAGRGTRGGKSQGPGSGSRLRKYVCPECGQILRASTDTLDANCNPCNVAFQLA